MTKVIILCPAHVTDRLSAGSGRRYRDSAVLKNSRAKLKTLLGADVVKARTDGNKKIWLSKREALEYLMNAEPKDKVQRRMLGRVRAVREAVLQEANYRRGLEVRNIACSMQCMIACVERSAQVLNQHPLTMCRRRAERSCRSLRG